MPNQTISTGRGGAGNIRELQKVDSNPTTDLPELKTKVVTTGRGGIGNMMENIDPESTRAAQDTGDTAFENSMQPVASRTVGRGGYGNNIRASSYDQGSDKKDETSLCGCF